LGTEVKPKSNLSSSFFSGGSGSSGLASSSSRDTKENPVFFFLGFPRFKLQGLLSISVSFAFVSVSGVAVVAEKFQVL
jgi:hypothetical protein